MFKGFNYPLFLKFIYKANEKENLLKIFCNICEAWNNRTIPYNLIRFCSLYFLDKHVKMLIININMD